MLVGWRILAMVDGAAEDFEGLVLVGLLPLGSGVAIPNR